MTPHVQDRLDFPDLIEKETLKPIDSSLVEDQIEEESPLCTTNDDEGPQIRSTPIFTVNEATLRPMQQVSLPQLNFTELKETKPVDLDQNDRDNALNFRVLFDFQEKYGWICSNELELAVWAEIQQRLDENQTGWTYKPGQCCPNPNDAFLDHIRCYGAYQIHDNRARWDLHVSQYLDHVFGMGSQLSDEQIDELEMLGFSWIANLERFKAFTKGARKGWVPPEHPELGTWAEDQRKQYKAKVLGRPCDLSKAQVSLLKEYGFQFVQDSTWHSHLDRVQRLYRQDRRWAAKFEAFQDYVREDETGSVPRTHYVLGDWAFNLRAAYAKRRDGLATKLTDDQVQVLDEAGFAWEEEKIDFRVDLARTDRFRSLTSFKEKYAPDWLPESSLELSVWVDYQREIDEQKYQGAALDVFRSAAPYIYYVTDNFAPQAVIDADATFEEFLGYIRLNGAYAPHGSKALSLRVSRFLERQADRGSKLSSQNVETMELLGYTWLANYERLKQYIRDEGDRHILDSTTKLGKWAATQRLEYAKRIHGKSNELSDAQLGLLNEIGFVLEQSDNTKWEDMYQKLRRFSQEMGHCHVTSNCGDVGLWNWFQEQYNGFQTHGGNDPLWRSNERLAKLNDIEATRAFFDMQRAEAFATFEDQVGDIKSSIPSARALQMKGTTEEPEGWGYKYEQLCAFVEQFGRCDPTPEMKPALIDWIVELRQQYHESQPTSLTEDQVGKLEKLDFVWSESDEDWIAMFLKFKELCDDGADPNCLDSVEKSLHDWVQKQQEEYRLHTAGQYSLLNNYKIGKLTEISQFQWNPSSYWWSKNFMKLKEYYEEHRHSNVQDKEDRSLRVWTTKQRNEYRFFRDGEKSSLTNDQVVKLKSVEFEFYDANYEWDQVFEKLKAYYEIFGHSSVGIREQPFLRVWSNRQRIEFRKVRDGVASKMTKSQIAKLNTINFEWTAPDLKWNRMYKRLNDYYIQNGHSNVQKHEDSALRTWATRQRAHFRYLQQGESSPITEERIAKLDEIGFRWRVDSIWEDFYYEIKIFRSQHGHFDCKDSRLKAWMVQQRADYKALGVGGTSGMDSEKVKMLDDIGFVWTDSGEWTENYDILKAHFEETGATKLSTMHPLYPWVTQQVRHMRDLQEGKEANLTKGQVSKLESIGIDGNKTNRSGWASKLQLLKEYQQQHGNTRVPRNHEIGEWVNSLRKYYRWLELGKRSPLNEKRIEELEDIGFEWRVEDGRWERRFNELKDFYQQNGSHTFIPSSKSALARWVTKQRAEYRRLKSGKQSGLTEERVSRLNEIGFEWVAFDKRWDDQYQRLLEYFQENGDLKVPRGTPLSNWVTRQRHLYRKSLRNEPSTITQSQIEVLQEIGLFD